RPVRERVGLDAADDVGKVGIAAFERDEHFVTYARDGHERAAAVRDVERERRVEALLEAGELNGDPFPPFGSTVVVRHDAAKDARYARAWGLERRHEQEIRRRRAEARNERSLGAVRAIEAPRVLDLRDEVEPLVAVEVVLDDGAGSQVR